MSAEIAFIALDKPTVAEFHSKVEEDHAEWWAKIQEFSREIGHENLAINTSLFGKRILGYHDDDNCVPGPGWRFDKRRGICVPNLRSKLGKEMEDRLEQLGLRSPERPGVRDYLHAPTDQNDFSSYMLAGSVQLGNDKNWYLSFGRKPFDDELTKIDPAIWELTTLAKFYTATEGADQ